LIERVERLVGVEVGAALEALAGRLVTDHRAEVRPPDLLELIGGVRVEAVVPAVGRVAVVRAADLNIPRVVSIKWEEGVVKLTHVESSVAGGVVTSDEQVDLLLGRVHTDGVETVAKLEAGELTVVVRVEDLEGIGEVEVRLHGKCGLLSLNVIFVLDQVSESLDKLILFTAHEDGLA
jgi:hypothetical protein